MAEYTWEEQEGGSSFVLVDKQSARWRIGHISRSPAVYSYHRAVVYPGMHTLGAPLFKAVAHRATEAEAKKAVEEYWADKDVLPEALSPPRSRSEGSP